MFVFALLLVLPALIIADPPANLEEDLFKLLDEDSNGKISSDEAVSYILNLDNNKDGTVTAQEFASGIDKVNPVFAGHEQALYAQLDRDGSGKVDKSDLEAAYKLVDKNGDGQVSKQEFKVAFADVVSNIGGSS